MGNKKTEKKETTKGIVMIAAGRAEYGKFAANMAISLKYHNPSLPIQLICEEGTISGVHHTHRELFDVITYFDESDAYDIDGRKKRLNPGRLKLSIYKYLLFDESIYLDVDGICIQNLDSLFEQCTGDYYTHVFGANPLNVDEVPGPVWADHKAIREHYNLKDIDIWAINSSFAYIRKGDQAEKLFSQALDNFNNPVPKAIMWGGTQPDELYMDIALGQLGIDPTLPITPKPVYFRTQRTKEPILKLPEIEKEHYFIGVFGGQNYCHSTIVGNPGLYDSLVHKYSVSLLKRNIDFKYHRLKGGKHVR